jgi:plastocyanin
MKLIPLAVSAMLLFAAGADAAGVSGNVSFQTKRGQKPELTQTLVWLEPIAAKLAVKKPAVAPVMTTRGKAFLPHVLAVPVGSTVSFPNEDPISHNLFSLTPGNTFDLGLYRKGLGKTHTFTTPGTVNVYCNVHPNMSAVIHVMPTQHYTFADKAGNYTFDVPPGRYRLVAWNELAGTIASEIDVTASGVTGNRALVLDSRSHRFVQHSNKVGKPYPPPSSKDY